MSIIGLHHALHGCKKSKQHGNCQKEPEILIYGASAEYITVWFQIITQEVQTFAKSLCWAELLLSGRVTAHCVLQGTQRGRLHQYPSSGVSLCRVHLGWWGGWWNFAIPWRPLLTQQGKSVCSYSSKTLQFLVTFTPCHTDTEKIGFVSE